MPCEVVVCQILLAQQHRISAVDVQRLSVPEKCFKKHNVVAEVPSTDLRAKVTNFGEATGAAEASIVTIVVALEQNNWK